MNTNTNRPGPTSHDRPSRTPATVLAVVLVAALAISGVLYVLSDHWLAGAIFWFFTGATITAALITAWYFSSPERKADREVREWLRRNPPPGPWPPPTPADQRKETGHT